MDRALRRRGGRWDDRHLEALPGRWNFCRSATSGGGDATGWPAARTAMLSVPMPLMIGLNIGRIFAMLFFLLAAEGRLSGPFPVFAGWGDIITGVVAVPLLWLVNHEGTRRANAIAAWNLFGAADLALAITLGVTSAEGSPFQIFPGPGSA